MNKIRQLQVVKIEGFPSTTFHLMNDPSNDSGTYVGLLFGEISKMAMSPKALM